MKIKPLFDNILIKAIEEKKSKSGILLPNSVQKEKPEEGTVVAVGPGALTKEGEVIPMNVSIGDKVLFTKYGVTEITIKNTDYLMAKESEILAIIG